MRLAPESRIGPCRSLLIVFLFASIAASQNLPKLPGTADSNAASSGEAAAATSGGSAAAAATSGGDTASETGASQASNKATATKQEKESGTTIAASSLPGISSASAAATTDPAGLTGLPKLAGYDYPPPTVPPTADAPFMQKSTLPDGTVFICVGAGLGFIFMLVLAWRGLVAWSIHRSVRQAAIAQSKKYANGRDPRSVLASGKSPYFSPAPGSTLSLDHLTASGKGVAGKQASAHNSLFFSPTAAAGMQNNSTRGSAYLPAGYYASGAPAPSGMTHIGGGAVPTSNLGNQNRHSKQRYSRNPSPPRSPSLPPSRGADSIQAARLSTQGLINHQSTSSLNLSATPQGRAPSAYLEDLFEHHDPGQSASEDNRRTKR